MIKFCTHGYLKFILEMSSYCVMLSVKASSHDTTILWLYNILCPLFFIDLLLCNFWVSLATRESFIMASTSPMFTSHFVNLIICILWDENKQIEIKIDPVTPKDPGWNVRPFLYRVSSWSICINPMTVARNLLEKTKTKQNKTKQNKTNTQKNKQPNK